MPVYLISVPPSANALYANSKSGGRHKTKAYAAWTRGELKALLAQRAKPIGARAIIKITVPHNNRIDADNKIKPTLDLLVRAGVLADDSCKYVAEVSAAFGDVRECHVSVEAE